MSLVSGTKLGPYEIESPLGAGGMGEVYRARDTRLGRDVAIKILPQHLSEDPGATQRFEREARAVSSLNHPHICTLYDVGHQDGTDFLVMELVEGETLAKRLEKGPLATAELLRTGIEISDALDKAHRKGILHRDLKPSNIMLTKSGAKLMDFGLAKAAGDGAAPALTSLTQSLNPSGRTTPVTAQGTIVGTFQYMSPEQMEGKEADARSDIFSFGAVLFEMATGKRAFEGKTTASVIAAILEREPPAISSVQPMSPPALDRTVKICLAKDPDERFQSAHDVKLQLEWIREAGSQAGVPAPVIAHRKNRERIAWGVVALFAIGFAFAIVGYVARAPQPARVVIAEISSPANMRFVFTGAVGGGSPVLSPDGQRLAFIAGDANRALLWVRSLNSTMAQPLEGTDGASFPFWSPDGRYLGFFANGKLYRIDASGGPALALADAQAGGRGGAWAPDGTILFGVNDGGALRRIPASGGTPQPVRKLDESLKDTSQRWPQFLPDGRHFLFFAGAAGGGAVYAGSLDGGEPKLLFANDSNAVYASPGYLLFIREGTLMAQHFDPGSLRLSGDAAPVTEHAAVLTTVSQGILTASGNGMLAYETGEDLGGARHLWWRDRSGKEVRETDVSSDLMYWDPAISPDGRKLAVAVAQKGAQSANHPNIWVFDLARGIKTRITFSTAGDRGPTWTPDGRSIVFFSNRSGLPHLYEKASDGTGVTTPLVADDAAESVPSFSSDGQYLLFHRRKDQRNARFEIWAMPMAGDRKPFPVIQNQFDQVLPVLSPDDKWLAYV
ncbi:MAG TPA: protein kinase, partial [Candidatus Acidoferrales bacterium]|nr:protein kinase [Candidatus Acidoferrales bacterium]